MVEQVSAWLSKFQQNACSLQVRLSHGYVDGGRPDQVHHNARDLLDLLNTWQSGWGRARGCSCMAGERQESWYTVPGGTSPCTLTHLMPGREIALPGTPSARGTGQQMQFPRTMKTRLDRAAGLEDKAQRPGHHGRQTGRRVTVGNENRNSALLNDI